MTKKPPNPWYFKYHDYIKVKESFDYTPTEEIDYVSARDLIKDIHNTPTKGEMLYKTFYDFKKFVRRHYCFVTIDQYSCCNYINYWLNKTVRESDYNVDKQKFEIFDKFMQVDPKIKDSSIDCVSKLSYMDDDMFEKMKKLYELYDYFTDLKKKENSSSLCKNISSLAEKYDSAFKKCNENDNYFCKMLTNLKDVIARDELVAKNICTQSIFDAFYLKIDPPPPPKKPTAPTEVQVPRRNHGRADTRTTDSITSPQAHGIKPEKTHTTHLVSASSSRTNGLREQAGVEREGTSSILPEEFPQAPPGLSSVLPSGLSSGLSSGSLELSRQPLPLPSLGQPESSEREEYIGPKGPYGISEPESELRQEQPQEQEGYRPEHDVHHFSEDNVDTSLQKVDPSAGTMQPTFNTKTLMERMKIAVSNVFEQVEPAPILGVSGGMGALFLLFKYTPVGSFFGGRRGRMHRIPNNFGEYYAGFAPGFAEQDYENFGNERYNISYRPE
ncbi:Plasmodium vivax Vir protein, putative [Plasmodium vivax]|nr:Plasmodium vivax Vir protein, putative [Plasmodium vivax]